MRYVLFPVAVLLFSAPACQVAPVPPTGPKGKGWVVYNQKFNHRVAAASSSTTRQGNYVVTTTQSFHSSTSKVLEGSYKYSKERPSCRGFTNIKECKIGGAQ